MSFRYVGRVIYQAGMRAMLAMKDQASKKCEPTLKSLRESVSSSSSSSSSAAQARRFSSALDSAAFKAKNAERLKQSEESLRTVMYLSCWGPN